MLRLACKMVSTGVGATPHQPAATGSGVAELLAGNRAEDAPCRADHRAHRQPAIFEPQRRPVSNPGDQQPTQQGRKPGSSGLDEAELRERLKT